MKFEKILLSIFVVSLFFCCENTTISMAIVRMENGKIEIDCSSIQDYVVRKISDNPGDTLYYLDLDKGGHKLKIITNDHQISDTTFNVFGGETYLGIDLATGEVTL